MLKDTFLSKSFIFLVILGLFRLTAESQTLYVQPLGNSITQAESNTQSYRYRLWKKLIDDGIEFQFVGSMNTHFNCGTPNFPNYMGKVFNKIHEGHWGWKTYNILNGPPVNNWGCRGTNKLSVWLGGYTPEISLIHLGTNDVLNNEFNLPLDRQIDTTIWFIERVIDTLRYDNPNVTIFLAQLIPTTNSNGYKIPLLNAKIPQIAINKLDPNSPIVIVDQYTGFNPAVGADTYDGTHPNPSGEEKMAQKWRDAIFGHLGGFSLDLKLLLEGVYNGVNMHTGLIPYIPLAQPFNTVPWNYQGAEAVESVPAGIVDWVLVELRDATDAASADETTVIARKAGFLKDDGSITYLDGNSNIGFVKNISNNLFVVVRHRNHLPILTSSALVPVSGKYTYDFSVSGAFGTNAMKDFGGGTFVMIAGDMNADGVIDNNDKIQSWDVHAGKTGYLNADVNLDGRVDNLDKNDFWFINQAYSSQLPQSD
jgi:hypothetical protein